MTNECVRDGSGMQYITKFGEVALTEAADLVSEMHNGKEIVHWELHGLPPGGEGVESHIPDARGVWTPHNQHAPQPPRGGVQTPQGLIRGRTLCLEREMCSSEDRKQFRQALKAGSVSNEFRGLLPRGGGGATRHVSSCRGAGV
eukprot:1196435-Prorocentrum_minimum.AAC.9